VKPVVDEHSAIVNALRAHLSTVIDSLLFATEEKAIAEARRTVEAKRARYGRPVTPRKSRDFH
jgi:GntR family transcriptional regulator, hexuronate regulon transcriptional repressor